MTDYKLDNASSIISLDPKWPLSLKEEFANAVENGHVGMSLISTSERVRIWHIALAPGDRLPVHKHVLDDFWTALSNGKGRLHFHDGRTVEHDYFFGETLHSKYPRGKFMMHDLENIGETELRFITVEFLNSENAPLNLKIDQ